MGQSKISREDRKNPGTGLSLQYFLEEPTMISVGSTYAVAENKTEDPTVTGLQNKQKIFTSPCF